VPHVVSGIVHDVNVREADHRDDKDAERHGESRLRNPANIGDGNW
jgi:hypothetical protein